MPGTARTTSGRDDSTLSASTGPTSGATRGDGGNVVPLRHRVREDGGILITDARPPRPIGSARGRWAYALGEHVDGLPRGVWVHITDTPEAHWALVAPLPHVLAVIDQPHEIARFRVLYCLALARPDAPDVPVDLQVSCSRGEVMSGRWAERLGTVLSADPPVIRAAARALLELAEHAPRGVRG